MPTLYDKNTFLRSHQHAGFTLIELSIVLVIIGLIVGGVLTGQDLIKAAALRAQVSQIEKYNTAINTFRLKYGQLPGDIADPLATQFGFNPVVGDGNGELTATADTGPGQSHISPGTGELAAFWVHLSQAQLIDGSFIMPDPGCGCVVSGQDIEKYIPPGKIGQGNYLYLWSGGPRINGGDPEGDGLSSYSSDDGFNYFALSEVGGIMSIGNGGVGGGPGLTVAQAYGIDKKIDDGYPQSGAVIAMYLQGDPSGSYLYWAGANDFMAATNDATAADPANCYDNNGITGAQTYAMAQNANLMNCALSFRWQ